MTSIYERVAGYNATIERVGLVSQYAQVASTQDLVSDAVVTTLVRALVSRAFDLGLTWDLAFGEVTQLSDDYVPFVLLDSDDEPLLTQSLIGYVAVGHRVAVLRVRPSERYVIGNATVAPGFVDAVNMTTNPVATSASSTWVNASAMRLDGYLLKGAMYLISGQVVYYTSNTNTEGNIRMLDPYDGSQYARVRLGKLFVTGSGVLAAWNIPYAAIETGEATFLFELARAAGSGTVTVQGGDHGWNSVSMIGNAGTVRTA